MVGKRAWRVRRRDLAGARGAVAEAGEGSIEEVVVPGEGSRVESVFRRLVRRARDVGRGFGGGGGGIWGGGGCGD